VNNDERFPMKKVVITGTGGGPGCALVLRFAAGGFRKSRPTKLGAAQPVAVGEQQQVGGLKRP
jgi:hypothetical protein